MGGLIDLALEALALVGLRGLQSTVLPLLFAVAVAAIILAMQNMLFMSGNLDLDSIDLDAAFALLEDASIGDVFVPGVLGVLSANSVTNISPFSDRPAIREDSK